MKKIIKQLLALCSAAACIWLPALQSLPAAAAEESPAAAADDGETASAQYLIPENAKGSAVDLTSDYQLQLWSRTEGHQHGFYVQKNDDGTVCFMEATTALVIEVPDGLVGKGKQLQLSIRQRGFDADKQKWILEETPDGSWIIRSKLNSSYVMDNYLATQNNGAKIVIDKYNGGTNQLFRLADTAAAGSDLPDVFSQYGADEGYAIMPVHAAAKAIDVKVATEKIQIYEAHRGSNQIWRIRRNGDFVYFESDVNRKVLEVSDGTASNGAAIGWADYNGSDKQLWQLRSWHDGTYSIQSKLNTAYVLDVSGVSTSDGAAMHLWTDGRGKNQHFYFMHMTTPEARETWGASRHDCFGADWDIWDGSVDTSWYYADRNAQVFYIDSAADLAGLSLLVRERIDNFAGQTVVLTRDLNLAGINWYEIGTNADHPFCGSFNGGGHAIIGLIKTDTPSLTGLFGFGQGCVITNFALQGSMQGDDKIGAVCGCLQGGIIADVYSEVVMARSIDDDLGGICGNAKDSCIYRCTQNARVNSGDKDPYRGGIVGYNRGMVSHCVNEQTVECNWDEVGGIVGKNDGGTIEYCANYGEVGGGGDASMIGGIAGSCASGSIVFGCFNSGKVHSAGDDWVGGIVGRSSCDAVDCCINIGEVSGREYIGGIIGQTWNDINGCYSGGFVHGSKNVGGICGSCGKGMTHSRVLEWSTRAINGNTSLGNKGAEWINAQNVISGKLCYDLNQSPRKNYENTKNTIFYQSIGTDMYPDFAGTQVSMKNGSYINAQYVVNVICSRAYGCVTGGGTNLSGAVTLTAEPAVGYMFDHFEICTAKVGTKEMYKGTQSVPDETVEIRKDAVLELTENIDRCYTVRAVFTVFDDVPEDLRQKVKVQLECTNECSGWNNGTIPVYLIDSAGNQHYWGVDRTNLDDPGDSQTHTFDIGAASPVAVYAYPDFGGGVSFRDWSVKAKIWVNDAGTAMESSSVTVKSWPFLSPRSLGDYAHISFADCGNATVGTINSDGSYGQGQSYSKCSEAWEAAKQLGNQAYIRLESAWLLGSVLTADKKEVTVDLNGYPVIRTAKRMVSNGYCFDVMNQGVLNIVDSRPSTQTTSVFKGGSIQGGRSTNGAGLIFVREKSTLNMQGGTLYNGATASHGGGAIHAVRGAVNLTNVRILNCWTDSLSWYQDSGWWAGSWAHDNNGGAISAEGGTLTMSGCTVSSCRAKNHAGALLLQNSAQTEIRNSTISGCTASEDSGGGIYLDQGHVELHDSVIRGNRTTDNDRESGGGICIQNGSFTCENTLFENNCSTSGGGAILANCGADDAIVINGCRFTGNYASGKAGAVDIWNIGRKKAILSDCEFTGNRSGEEGGAMYVNDHYTVLNNAVFRNNSAETSGGAIYINGCYLGVQGIIVVEDNTVKGKANNLYLTGGGRLTTGGLLEGSSIHVTPAGKSNQTVMNQTSAKQLSYIKVDGGKATKKNVKTVKERFLSSAIGSGNLVMIVTGIAVILIAAAAVFIVKKRRKKALPDAASAAKQKRAKPEPVREKCEPVKEPSGTDSVKPAAAPAKKSKQPAPKNSKHRENNTKRKNRNGKRRKKK